MSLKDIVVQRIYKCTECELEFAAKHALKDYSNVCPNCEESALIIKEGHCSISVFVKQNNKLWHQSKINYDKGTVDRERIEKEKHEAEEKRKIQDKAKQNIWWRDPNKKIDYSILKNPKKYIETGEK